MKTSVCPSIQSVTSFVIMLSFILLSCCPNLVVAWEPYPASNNRLFQVEPKTNYSPNPILAEIVAEPDVFYFTLDQGENGYDILTLTLIADVVVDFQIKVWDDTHDSHKSSDADWLWFIPETGSLWPWVPFEVEVFIETTGLEPGIYQELLWVESLDPWVPGVEFDVFLEVIDTNMVAEIILSHDSIYQQLYPYQTAEQSFYILNTGDSVLSYSIGYGAFWRGEMISFPIAQNLVDVVDSPCTGEYDAELTIISPQSTLFLSDEEEITIEVKNVGSANLTNIPVIAIFENDTVASEIIPITITPGNVFQHTFSVAVDMGVPGCAYYLTVCTAIENDICPENNCLEKLITHMLEDYCMAYNSTEDEYIANVKCGDIDNSSSWQGWVSDYTDISTIIPVGYEETIIITNGHPYASDIVTVWVDWNNNVEFELGNEVFPLENVGWNGEFFTGNIVAPLGATSGPHRMRIRMSYSNPPSPCCTDDYGEAEDYTIIVPDTDPGWLEVLSPTFGYIYPGDSAKIDLLFSAEHAIFGVNEVSMILENSSPSSPLILPITLELIGSNVFPPPPQNLVGWINNYEEVILKWEPLIISERIHWDDGINADGIGLAGIYEWHVAARWEGADLEPHAGMYLSAVDFFARSELGAEYIIKVWTGENASALMTEQLVEEYTSLQWITVVLDNPVLINPDQELWIGYNINEPNVGDFPAGCDAGPAIAYYGDMISMNAVSWESMSAGYGLDYNWNIAGLLSYDSAGKLPAEPLYIGQIPKHSSSQLNLSKGNLPFIEVQKNKNAPPGLTGYNVYRDAQLINTAMVTDTFYIEPLPSPGTYEYYVTALYDQFESEPSNIVTITSQPPMPEIQVEPDELIFEVPYGGGILMEFMYISNIGYDTLDYTITISYEMTSSDDDWIIVDPSSGSLLQGQTNTHDVLVDIYGPGQYGATIIITSNDPNSPVVEIPVILYYMPPVFDPPQNLRTEVVNINRIELSWDPPLGKPLLFYNIYREGTLIGNTSNTTYYSDEYGPGIYTFYVSAVYDDGESMPAGPAEAIVGCPLPAPQAFEGIKIVPDLWEFVWQPPEEPEMLGWSSGENAPATAMAGGSFHYVTRWEPDHLQAWEGYYLSHVQFLPKENPSTEFSLKIWKGANAANLVLEQPVLEFIPEIWNTIRLNESIPIYATDELWIGFEVSFSSGNSPAGHDSGPAVAGYGDLISLDNGATWESMSIAFGLDYNWNIRGILFQFPDTDYYFKEAFSGYNFYRDSIRLNSEIINETTYTDSVSAWGHHYHISAVYEDCEAFSDPWTPWIGISENALNENELYPNPATEEVFITSTESIIKVTMLSLLGNVVLNKKLSNKEARLDVSDLNPGIYIVEIKIENGIVVKKLVVE